MVTRHPQRLLKKAYEEAGVRGAITRSVPLEFTPIQKLASGGSIGDSRVYLFGSGTAEEMAGKGRTEILLGRPQGRRHGEGRGVVPLLRGLMEVKTRWAILSADWWVAGPKRRG
jgi:hypothetical protein